MKIIPSCLIFVLQNSNYTCTFRFSFDEVCEFDDLFEFFGELDEFGEFSDFDEFGEFGAFVEFCDFHEVGEFYEFSSFARSLRNDETFLVKSNTVRNQAFIFTQKLL